MNTLGDIILIAVVAMPCVMVVIGMRGLYLEARRALLGRDND